MMLIPRLAGGSAVAVAFLISLFVLLGISGTLGGRELILLVAVTGVSLPIGVLLGFLAARRILLKCMPAGFYRKKPAYWWWSIPILFSVFGYRAVDLFPLQILSAAFLGELGILAAIAPGMALFERRVGCHLSLVGDPGFWSRWVEYRVESQHDVSMR